MRDHAEIALHFLPVHADAVIRNGDGARVPIHGHADAEVLPCKTDALIRQGLVAELVDCIGGVGDDFAQENLLMRVDGVDHHVQQPPGFRFELFLCHIVRFLK